MWGGMFEGSTKRSNQTNPDWPAKDTNIMIPQ